MSPERIYTASSIIIFPRMSANEYSTLAGQLLIRSAKRLNGAPALPQLVADAKQRVQVAQQVLADALSPRPPEDTEAARAADNKLDRCWGAFYDWTVGFMAIEDLPGHAHIKALYALVFGEGRAFVQATFREEHAESQARLDAIAREGHEALITELGGGPILGALKQAHAEYGEVLGITAKVDATADPAIREKMASLADAMKDYVLKVVAHRIPGQPQTDTMVDDLLEPLIHWKDQTRGTVTKEEPGMKEALVPNP